MTPIQRQLVAIDEGFSSGGVGSSETPDSCIGPPTPSFDSTTLSNNGDPPSHVSFSNYQPPHFHSKMTRTDWLTPENKSKAPSSISSRSSDKQPFVQSISHYASSISSAIRRVHPLDNIRQEEHSSDDDEDDDDDSVTASTTRQPAPQSSSIPIIRREPPTNTNTPASSFLQVPKPASSMQQSMTSLASATSRSTVPLTAVDEMSTTGDGILMKGKLLCAIYMKWFSRRVSMSEATQEHLRLRQTRLSWRQFEAVLRHDRLQLYLVTNLVIKTRRLAHTIYLRPQRSKNIHNVHLSLVSPLDFTWRLEFESCQGRTVQFYFCSRTVPQSQAWYMALYRHSTIITTPLPSLIDLYIPSYNNLKIRLPLVQCDLKINNHNIRAHDIKRAILSLMERQDIKPDHWTMKNVQLCWHREGQQYQWIPDTNFIVDPQLIEKTHTLQLRYRPQRLRPEENTPRPVMEGDLVLQTDLQGNELKNARSVYAMIEGNLMFLLDPVKASRPPGAEEPNDTPRWSFARISGATLISARAKRGFRSVTRFFHHNNNEQISVHGAEKECRRRAKNITHAFAVLDLTRGTRVRRRQQTNVEQVIQQRAFEIHIDNVVLQMEAPTMHTMFEWIQWIHKLLQTLGRQLSRDVVPLIGQTRLGFRIERRWKGVLHAGMLYVRQDYLDTFKQRYCVLIPGKKLVLFRTCRRKRCSGAAQLWTSYEHFATLKLDRGVYIHGDDAQQHESKATRQPPRIYADGTIVSSQDSSSNADCSFVIWQTAQRHILVTLRERLSTFKFGHRLGRKGTVWVFLARSEEEKSAWMWALHQAIE